MNGFLHLRPRELAGNRMAIESTESTPNLEINRLQAFMGLPYAQSGGVRPSSMPGTLKSASGPRATATQEASSSKGTQGFHARNART